MKTIKSISFIGSGNVATNLAKAFYAKGVSIDTIYSNTLRNAELLAKTVEATAINKIENHEFTSDLVIVALKDDVMENVLSKTTIKGSLLVHTSGSIDTITLKKYAENFGCLYPFQTFRKEVETDFSEVHIFIESNSKENTLKLYNLARLLTSKVEEMNSYKRKSLHIAGVGLNNFTHFILSITRQYCIDNQLKTEYLTNLLTQTVNNSFYIENALSMQTGPARRGDLEVIKDHLERLKNAPKYRKIYKTISQLILDEFHDKKYKL